MRELSTQILAWSEASLPFALATVLRVEGSGPREVGSCLIVSDDGSHFAGAVSSGCLENEVIEAGVAVLRERSWKLLQFGPEGSPPWREGLSCGGRVEVRVEPWWGCSPEPSHRECAARVLSALRTGAPVAVLSRGDRHLAVGADAAVAGNTRAFAPAFVDEARLALAHGRASRLMDSPDGELFLRIVPASPRLLLVGAVDIAVHLVPLAQACGFQVTVVDPRGHYARHERFFHGRPSTLIHAWPQDCLPSLALGPRDSALVLTHDPKIDDLALEVLLRSAVGYIGALGSQESHRQRLIRLRERGLDEVALARIESPAGIRLGRRDSVSIAAGMLAGLLRER